MTLKVKKGLNKWKEYLSFLGESKYSINTLTGSLAPGKPIDEAEKVTVNDLSYSLWPFQQKILDKMGTSNLILGLPTGLGKTFLAGAYLKRESNGGKIRVLFLVPTIPLGVQQTLFARNMLNLEGAFMVSGEISPEKRRELKVWNNPFVVSTPQTFSNDYLEPYSWQLREARESENPIPLLAKTFDGFTFPFDIVVADECQGYIGQTDGYSILMAAKASGCKIVALSATPQLHAPERLMELEKIFDRIHVFSIEDPEIKQHVPDRTVTMIRIRTPEPLLKVYHALGSLISSMNFAIRKKYGNNHPFQVCKQHFLCKKKLALKMLRYRLVEDGASSILGYTTWNFPELRNKKEKLGGKSIYDLYREALKHTFNHKLFSALKLLRQREYEKVIMYVESVVAAKQLAAMLHKQYGMEKVAVLVGKSNMSMDHQASALLHFKEKADILVCTSIGEEGLDIPSADVEIWLDYPSNPKKWIQRFGRILRQPGDKSVAKVYALISMGTHETEKFLAVKRKTETVYGFTQRLKTATIPFLSKNQRTLLEYKKE
jgi:ERCC4-related helicase